MMPKRLLRIASATGAILLLLVALTGATLATDTGTKWSLRQLQRLVPNLQLEQINGSWWHGLEINRLSWLDTTAQVHIDNLRLRASFPALLMGTLHIAQLSAQSVAVDLSGEENPASPTSQLPTLFIPFTLKLAALQVAHLQINDSVAFHDAALSLHWRGSHLNINKAKLAWADGHAQISGRFSLTDDYPLSLEGSAQHKTLPGALTAKLRGSLRTLNVTAAMDGQWPLRARGQLQPLETGLPLSLELTTNEPITVGEDTETLRVDTATLSIQGQFERLAGKLRIELHENRYGHSKLHANLEWQDERLTVSQARWQLADGSQPLHGACEVVPRQQQWQCDGQLHELSLAPWLPQQSGKLSTPWQASGHTREAMALTVALPKLHGELGNTTISGGILVETEDGEHWQLQRIQLAVGDNTLTASGTLGNNSAVRLDAQLPQLAQLYPSLHGSAKLQATLKGPLSMPDIAANLDARKLVYGGRRAQQLSAKLLAPQLAMKSSSLKLTLRNAIINEARAPLSAVLRASGNRQQQQWRLELNETDASDIALDCRHTLNPQFDRGDLHCSQLGGHLVLRQHTLPLSLPRALNIRWQQSEPRIEAEPFCLLAGEARLCLEQTSDLRPSSDRPLAVSLHSVPLQWLAAYAPQPIELASDTHLNGSLAVERWQPLSARAQVQIPSFSWPNPKQKDTVLATINTINAQLTVNSDQAILQATARSDELGELALATAVDDPNGKRRLDGQLRIQGLQTGAFGWLLPEDYQLTGQLDAGLQLGGSVTQPSLRGTLTLTDGTATVPGLEESLRELGLRIQLDNRQARFKGDFLLGAGQGEISGGLDIPEQWQEWQLHANVITRAVQFTPLPDSGLTLSSSLALQANTTAIRLQGDVNVDRANIQIRQLPPDTQRVSSDVEIVGGEVSSGPDLFMNLQLNLGENFHFTGLGAEVDLAGKLQLRQQPQRNLSAHGEVRIRKGRYRAYGQRLTVRRGSFLFNGPLDNPDIDLRALRDMPPDSSVEVGVDVTGSLRNPLATLFSSPPMADTETAYYLLTGKPPPEFGQATQLSAESALLSIGVAGASARAARVAEKIGISDFQISATESEQGTEAQVSGYLTPRLYVRYGTGLQQGANSVTFQYRVTRQLLLEAVTGLEQALDVLYSFSIE